MEFRERFLEATGGQWAWMWCSIRSPGEFVDASLELLGEGGRFVEMGKTDVRDAGQVADAHPGVAYRAFDLIEAGPERIQEMLVELREPVRARVCLSRCRSGHGMCVARPEAFRFMSQARHVGKNVLTLPVTAFDG